MKVAAVQMCSGPDVAANLARAGELLAAAARDGAELAVLPENFAIMGRDDAARLAAAEDEGSGPIQDFLARAAVDLGITLIGGTMSLKVPGDPRRVAAASLAYGPGGRLGRYDKIHLFDVDLPDGGGSYRESAGIAPGSGLALVPTSGGLLGLSVCYDLRFPELYRALSAQGATLLAVPSAFTVPTGEAHWHVLLRARAIENQCAVIAAAQWGEHANGRRTYGHSLVVDAWGRMLAELPSGEGHVLAELDLAAQRRLRNEFPALTHRVPGLGGDRKP